MKYFTPEWWAAGCEDRAPIEAYQAEFSRIKADLPPDIVLLEELHTLHDGRLEELLCEFTSGEVSMRLAGWNRDFSKPACYSLTFKGVTVLEQRIPSGRNSDPEFGDLGYWEYALCPAGVEMRVLFVSSAELRIVFSAFSFSVSGAVLSAPEAETSQSGIAG
jgi:hypothetical protein